VDGAYRARVKGTYATLPPGYPWVFIPWWAIVMVLVEIQIGFPSAAGVLFLAAGISSSIANIYILANAKPRAFAADTEGIQLGVRRAESWQDRRKRTVIPWDQVLQIRISPSGAGSTAEILLAASAPLPRSRVLPLPVTFALAIVPTTVFLGRPAMLIPLTDPPRYRVPLYQVKTADLVSALRSVAPASVPIIEAAASYSSQ
jgi:hypothetical protein